MHVDDLATQTMEYASGIMKAQDELLTTDARLKVLYQVTKLIEVCKTRESVVHQYHVTSIEQPSPGGVS